MREIEKAIVVEDADRDEAMRNGSNAAHDDEKVERQHERVTARWCRFGTRMYNRSATSATRPRKPLSPTRPSTSTSDQTSAYLTLALSSSIRNVVSPSSASSPLNSSSPCTGMRSPDVSPYQKGPHYLDDFLSSRAESVHENSPFTVTSRPTSARELESAACNVVKRPPFRPSSASSLKMSGDKHALSPNLANKSVFCRKLKLEANEDRCRVTQHPLKEMVLASTLVGRGGGGGRGGVIGYVCARSWRSRGF